MLFLVLTEAAVVSSFFLETVETGRTSPATCINPVYYNIPAGNEYEYARKHTREKTHLLIGPILPSAAGYFIEYTAPRCGGKEDEFLLR